MIFPHPRHLAIPLTLLSLAVAAPAWSQAHETRSGAYTVRASTVPTDTLSEASAKIHGIERAPTRGILNVTVMKGEQTIPAHVTVMARGLTGKVREIGMKETNANGYVSYSGTYDFVHGEVLDFTARATPYDSRQVIALTFRDRMWGEGDLPQGRTQR